MREDAVFVTPGIIEYVDAEGIDQIFFFQANPTSLTRARSITFTPPQASLGATKTARGEAGRTFTLKADNWKIEGIELMFDASMPHWSSLRRSSDEGVLNAVQEGIAHLERLAEPGSWRGENTPNIHYPPLPGPPLVVLSLGSRTWKGYVTSVRIEEKQFTPDLVPTRVRATLGFEVITTPDQLEQGKIGGRR
jgi:hypothetical protein